MVTVLTVVVMPVAVTVAAVTGSMVTRQEMSSCGRGRVRKEEAERLEAEVIHPPPSSLSPARASTPLLAPSTGPSSFYISPHPTAPTMAVQASYGRVCSSSNSSSMNGTGRAVLDRQLVMAHGSPLHTFLALPCHTRSDKGEAMWGHCEAAWYKMLIGAMLRRAEVLAGKEGGDGEGGSGGRWEEEARGVEEEMRVKGVRADHEVRGLLRKLRGMAHVQQGRAECGDDEHVE
ncbi:unnamed protein product [Closterium sp. Naga37s-1]|nr:unnamed protein product [Closterium sp. Naga37s-1]